MVGIWTYAWRSPTGVIHGGHAIDMRTACGIRVPPRPEAWKVVISRLPTCQRCERCQP